MFDQGFANVLPNANTTHLISSYSATYSLFNDDEY